MITRTGISTLASGGGIVAAVVCLLVGLQLLLLGSEIHSLLEEKVDAAPLAVGDLTAQGIVTCDFRDGAGFDGFLHDGVRPARVDADPGLAHADELERVSELALRVLAVGDDHPAARPAARRHRAGIRAMHGEGPAVVELDVGEEALVAAHESPFDHRVIKLHDGEYTRRVPGPRIPRMSTLSDFLDRAKASQRRFEQLKESL